MEGCREIIISLHKDGKTTGNILKSLDHLNLNLNRVFIWRVIKRYKETGKIGRRPSIGRPRPCRTPEIVKAVQTMIRQNPTKSLRKMAKELAEEYNISEHTARRIVKEDLTALTDSDSINLSSVKSSSSANLSSINLSSINLSSVNSSLVNSSLINSSSNNSSLVNLSSINSSSNNLSSNNLSSINSSSVTTAHKRQRRSVKSSSINLSLVNLSSSVNSSSNNLSSITTAHNGQATSGLSGGGGLSKDLASHGEVC
jgi:hypothetical protein